MRCGCVMAEVHNTHGEEHVYDLERMGDGAVYTSRAEKALYVSPFIDMDARYVFECREEAGGAYDLRIDEYKGEELFFQAQLLVSPRPLTNANVARMLARYPFMTLKTIGLIHWQGLKLWLRGVKFRPHRRKRRRGDEVSGTVSCQRRRRSGVVAAPCVRSCAKAS